MIYWLLQVADLVYYHIFHLFFAFGLFLLAGMDDQVDFISTLQAI